MAAVIEYYYLRVIDPDTQQQVLVYVDTSEQGMLYDPTTFQTDYKSNFSGNNIIDIISIQKIIKTSVHT